MRRVYVTGMGVVSPIGIGIDAFSQALKEGKSGVAKVTRFDTSALLRELACEVKDFHPRDYLTAAEARRTGGASAMALAAAREAFRKAELKEDALAGVKTAVILGTTMGDADIWGELNRAWLNQGTLQIPGQKLSRYGSTLLSIHLARTFKIEGIVQVLPAACAAGNYAIGYAADLIRSGRIDAAICGATEVIEKLQYSGFARLGAIGKEKCQPFDLNRTGLMVGEGAGIFILESEERVVSRQATPLAEIGGHGLACDAYHITRPHPEGKGSIDAIEKAIEESGIEANKVDLLNAHGTATKANDMVETKVVHDVFGDMNLPVTSIKSMIGHCMGASSAIEAVSCVLSLQGDWIPPTINYETPDPDCDLNIVINTMQKKKVDIVINNALAFGGYDAALCLAKPNRLPNFEEGQR